MNRSARRCQHRTSCRKRQPYRVWDHSSRFSHDCRSPVCLLVQDAWKVCSRDTLNLGLRYERLTQRTNLSWLSAINPTMIARGETIESPQRLVLDMDSTEIPVYRQQKWGDFWLCWCRWQTGGSTPDAKSLHRVANRRDGCTMVPFSRPKGISA